MTDERFERGREVGTKMNSSLGFCREMSGDEVKDFEYFLGCAIKEDRRKATRRGLHWGRRGSQRGRREKE